MQMSLFFWREKIKVFINTHKTFDLDEISQLFDEL